MRLDRKIRSAIVIDEDGDVVSVRFTSGSDRTLMDSQISLALLEIYFIMKMVRRKKQNYGKLHHIQITHENIVELIFPLQDEHTLLVSYEAREFNKEMPSIIVHHLRIASD